ncbi:MAG: PRC-barrel domain-containing protein [Clostridiales bacterium]
MELRSKNILGLPVFAISQGEKLGQVKDYVFHPEKKAIIALLISPTKRFGEEKILPFSNIKSLGQEAITLENPGMLEKKGANPEIATYLKKMANIIGVKVITVNGFCLGKATDFFIDAISGKITSIALGNGLVDQLLKGNNFLSSDMIDVFGNDVILANENAKPTMGKHTQSNNENSTTQNTSQGTAKISHSNTLWNQGKEIIREKTKTYITKSPESAVFNEIITEKENPSENVEKTHKTKGAISYKNDL